MNNLNQLPAHLQAFFTGEFSAVNEVLASTTPSRKPALNSAPVVVNMQANIADAQHYEIEAFALSDYTSFDILE
jgi:hypothetical protein